MTDVADEGDRHRPDGAARAELDRDLRELGSRLMQGERERFDLLLEIDRLRGRLRAIRSAPSYRLAGPLRLVERLVASLRKRRIGDNLRRVAAGLRGHMPARAAPPMAPGAEPYSRWIAAHDELDDADRAAIASRIAAFARRPLISVVMPVRDPPAAFLRAALDSVHAQLYPDWELCIADDASTAPHVRAILEDARADPRVKVAFRPAAGGITAASNAALELARGEFAALLDHDDVLAPHALYLVAAAILEQPDLTMIYSDEDLIEESGARAAPYFKPDWNPDLLLGHNCVSHLGCFRVETIRAIGGFRQGFEGSQDWDLALRVAARSHPRQIRHLPFVLYHWRRSPTGDNFSTRSLATAAESARRAVRQALAAQGHDCIVIPIGLSSFQRVLWPLPLPAPLVSVIIAAGDGRGDLRRRIEELRARTDYPALEILIVDDGRDRATSAVLDACRAAGIARVLHQSAAFGRAAANNRAAAEARGEVLLFLDRDVEPANRSWLAEMAAQAARGEIGAVGALLRDPDGGVGHGGLFVRGDGPFAAHRRHPRASRGVYGRLVLAQNFRAVSGACMAVRKVVFDQVCGFNEDLAHFGDVDFCLRVQAAGYRVLWTPFAELSDWRSASRSVDHGLAMREWAMLRQIWGAAIDEDPFHNPNLAPGDDGFGLADPPRVKRPWRRDSPVPPPAAAR